MFGAISEKFRTFDIQIILRFPQVLTFDGGWRDSFSFIKVVNLLSHYQSTYCVIFGYFQIVPRKSIQPYFSEMFIYLILSVIHNYLIDARIVI